MALGLALMLGACGAGAGGGGAAGAAKRPSGDQVVAGQLVVDFVDGTTQGEIDALEGDFGVDLTFNSVEGPRSGVALAEVVALSDELLSRLRAHPLVEAAEPLLRYHANHVPDDPLYPGQWHLRAVGAEEAWELADGRGVIVAVIDTGIAYTRHEGGHAPVEDLAGARFAPGWDFVNDRVEALDDHGHGTHVAGTIAQRTDNGVGVAGVAPRATLMPLKVLSKQGQGNSADIADAIRWAADHGAQVINLSLGGGARSEVMARAVRYARRKGAVIVAAAGNTGREGVNYPAAYTGVLAVSAVRLDLALAPYSTWGPEVALAAPGGDLSVDQDQDGQPDGVLQNTLDGGRLGTSVYAGLQGTSMAAPHVAGAAALIISAGVSAPASVEEILLESARPLVGRALPDARYGAGVLDAGAAVAAARGLGWGRLFSLLLVLAALGSPRRQRPQVLRPVFLGVSAWVGVGLFFLPGLLGPLPGAFALSAPLADWGRWVFGPGAHAHPLLWSALLPFAGALLLFHKRQLHGLLGGLSAGSAAFLLHAAVTGVGHLGLLSLQPLAWAWLCANAFVALLLAWTFVRVEARL